MIKLTQGEVDTLVTALEARAMDAWLQANYPERVELCKKLVGKLCELEKGPWVVLPQAAHIARAVRGDLLTAALKVLVLDERTAAWLEANDPKALAQARRALGL